MKIAYLSTARIPDDWGHVIQIMKMCEAFAELGHDVELVVPARAGTRDEDPYEYVGAAPVFAITKLPCVDLSATSEGKFFYWLRTLTFFFSMTAYMLFRRYDLVFTREPSAKLFMSSYVFEAHAVSPSVIRAAKAASLVVAITASIREELVGAGIPAAKILVAPDAVDLKTFACTESKEAARTRLGLPADKKLALYLGRIDAWKGTDALFGAAKLLPEDIRLVIIGAEPAEVDALRTSHPRIMFIAFRPYSEVADNQAAADVLVLPNTAKNAMSARYTSPLKLFTYMASGIPIVASDITSIREILNEGNAYLVAPDDANALADGIRAALAAPVEAGLRAAAARHDVERYTWKARAESILASLTA